MAAQLVDEVVRAKPDEHLIVVPASSTIAEAVALMVEREVGAVIAMTEDNLTWMTPERIGGLDWFVQRVPRNVDGTGRHDSYFHFQDGMHTIWFWSRI